MSKSTSRAEEAIYLLESPEGIRAKALKATTDSQREIRFDSQRPGLYNLLVIYELLTGLSREAIEARFAGRGYVDLKREVADVVIETLQPLQERFRVLRGNASAVERMLHEGAVAVAPLARRTLTEVKERMGLG